jgi:hypothetical protein
VIPFLVITSIVNIGLGYWLAVYLAKGSASGSLSQGDAAAAGAGNAALGAQRAGGLDFAWPPAATAAAAGSPSPPATNGQESAMAGATGHGQPAEADQAGQSRSGTMEQDLLAGIEEFRNQLAQLKSKGAFEPAEAGS